MTTYIDTYGLAPTEELAHLYARSLHLEGTLVPPHNRLWLALNGLEEGDEVLTGPEEQDFWMIAPPYSGVKIVPDGREVDRKKRAGSLLEWRLRLLGVGRIEARKWVDKPPTPRHSRHGVYLEAQKQASSIDLAEKPELGEGVQMGEPSADLDVEPYSYEIVTSPLLLGEVVELIQQAVSRGQTIGIDVETDTPGKEPDPRIDILVGIGFSFGEDNNYYIPFNGPEDDQPFLLDPSLIRAMLKVWIARVKWAGWNASYDALVMRNNGVPCLPATEDGQCAAMLLQRETRDLKGTVHELFGHIMWTFKEVLDMHQATKMSEVPIEKTGRYCCGDAWFGLKATSELVNKLHEDPGDGASSTELGTLYRDIEMPVHDILVRMTEAGMPLNMDKVTDRHEQVQGRLSLIRTSIENLTWEGFNPNSNADVVKVLHEQKGLPIQGLTRTGAPSVGALQLLRLKKHEPYLIKLLLLNRHYVKEDGTYLVPWIRQVLFRWLLTLVPESRVRTIWKQYRVGTGRLASEDPNFMNLPLDLRELVEGLLIVADYGQLEMRVAAWISREPALIEVFRRGGDIHEETCQRVFGVSRKDHPALNIASKALNFAGMLYGAGGGKVVELIEQQALENPELDIDIPAVKEANRWLGDHRKAYPRFYAWKEYVIGFTRDRGYSVTAWGWRWLIDGINSNDRTKRGEAERRAVNLPIQGTAAQLVKQAMVAVDRHVKGVRLLIQNHDELVAELVGGEEAVPQASKLLANMKDKMELGQPFLAGQWGVPLVVEPRLVRTWKEGK